VARITSPRIADALEPLIAGFDHPVMVIDVVGGHGGYILEFARR
jgi:hypothetical protein